MTALILLSTPFYPVDIIMSVVIFEIRMRVTPQQKEVTRQKLVRIAGDLFRDRGFAETTTRAIAQKARLASGTMFNYFQSKEELALAWLTDLATQAHQEFASLRRPTGAIEEWLFNFLSTELRTFLPVRTMLGNVLAQLADPCALDHSGIGRFRRQHMTQVQSILDHFNLTADRASTCWEYLYWSLYLGILSHWSSDPSPNQEATRTLIDNAIYMFLGMMRSSPDNIKVWR